MTWKDGTHGFVVLSAPRSGSTWLVDLLNHSTGATVHTELFIRRRKPTAERLMTPETADYLDATLRGYPLFCETTRVGFNVRPARTFQYLRQLYGQPGNGSKGIGFKLMYPNILDFPEVWAFVARHRLPVLHLVRRNHLDVYLSSEIRFATQTVHSLVGEPAKTGVQIELNTRDLLRALHRSSRNIEIARLMLRVSRVPHLEIHYEDLLQDRRTLETACEFLQLELESPRKSSRLRKLVTGSHSQLIKNYAEVSRALQGTEFEGLLR